MINLSDFQRKNLNELLNCIASHLEPGSKQTLDSMINQDLTIESNLRDHLTNPTPGSYILFLTRDEQLLDIVPNQGYPADYLELDQSITFNQSTYNLIID